MSQQNIPSIFESSALFKYFDGGLELTFRAIRKPLDSSDSCEIKNRFLFDEIVFRETILEPVSRFIDIHFLDDFQPFLLVASNKSFFEQWDDLSARAERISLDSHASLALITQINIKKRILAKTKLEQKYDPKMFLD